MCYSVRAARCRPGSIGGQLFDYSLHVTACIPTRRLMEVGRVCIPCDFVCVPPPISGGWAVILSEKGRLYM